MGELSVLAPVSGRAVAIADVPDPVFSQGMVGYGAAVNPPETVVDAVAPVAGKVFKLLPHAYVIMAADNIGVLVHLGLDTVTLNGAGFTTLVTQGEEVRAGQAIITYDVPSVIAAGLQSVVPVVIMDERRPERITPGPAVLSGGEINTGAVLFTVQT